MWGITNRFVAVIAIVAASVSFASPASASVAGTACMKQGQTLIASGKMHTCLKSGSKLVWSAAKPVVVSILNSPAPKINGKAIVDETLTAVPGTWDRGVTLSYQWFAGKSAIPGAQDRTFVPSEALIGQRISVRVTANKPGAKSVNRTSKPTSAVKAGANTSPPTQTLKILTLTATPTVTGVAKVNSRLEAQTGKWDSGVRFSYQWIRDNLPIEGATQFSYTLRESDEGSNLSVSVTGEKSGFRTVTRVSRPVAVTTSLKQFPSIGVVLVQGSALVGSILTVNVANWGVTGIKFDYQWFANGTSIPGGTNSTLRLSESTANQIISVVVTGQKSGYKTESRGSIPVGPVQSPSTTGLRQFLSAADPGVTGNLIPGSFLTATTAAWDVGVSYAWQWYRNGQPIPGATNITYQIQSEDANRQISVSLSGSKTGYVPQTRTTVIGFVTAGVLTSTPEPVIEGDAVEGATLRISANSLAWDSIARTTIQWLKNGVAIPGANSSTYQVSSADIGSVFMVAVTGTAPGYSSVTRTSIATQVIVSATIIGSKPTIAGVSQVGQTLTANAGYWEPGTTLAYQWLRNGAEIPGATGTTFSLTSVDNGTAISVRVTGSKTRMANLVLTSDPVNVTTTFLTLTPTPTITGVAQLGQTLTANPGTWDSGVSLAYQWNRNGSPVSGATSATYVITSADMSQTLTVSVRGSKTGFMSVTKESASFTITLLQFASAPVPVVSGTATVDQTLTATVGTWDSGATLAYQWLADGTAIAGATGTTFRVTSLEVGKVITFRVTATRASYVTTVRTSSGTSAVAAANFTAQPTPLISGTAQLDQTLTATVGTWDAGTSLAYQWLADGTAISGGTSTTFRLTAAQIGRVITFRVTATKAGYVTAVKTSAGTAAITAGSFSLQPTPVLSGTAMVGKQVTATPGTWDSGTTLAYQWLRGSSVIAGATSSTYNLVSADLGATITVQVTATKTGNLPLTKTSAGIGPVAAAAILIQGTPTITGTPQVGLVLTGSAGTWESGLSFSYQWLRNGTAIAGANSSTYTLVAADLSAVVSLRVTGWNSFASATRTSAATTAVQLGVFASSPAATFTGTYKVGTTLGAVITGWSPTATFTYKWLRNGIAITGATSTAYSLKPEDLGATFTFELTGSATGYTTRTVTSAPGGAVGAGTIVLSQTPTITGTPKVGQTLTATAASLTAGVTLTYQWLRNGSAISGATSATYVVQEADAGANVSVAVSGAATGYANGIFTSPTIKILTPPKLPTISSQFSRTTGFDVNWSWLANTSYVFSVKNSGGSVVASYTCSTACASPIQINGLPANSSAVNYTLEYTATTDGGSISGSTTASTYPTLNLNVNVTSIVRTGNQYVLNFDAIPGWTYQFSNYAVLDNSNCGITSGVQTSSPFTMWLPRGLCNVEFIITDGRGNRTNRAVTAPITTNPVPAPALSGSLSTNSATVAGNVSYSATYFSFFNYNQYNLVILNSSGVAVTPAIAPTSSRVGDLQSGTKTGVIYFLGLAPGTYTIRLDFKSSNDTRYGYNQEASITLGTVTVR